MCGVAYSCSYVLLLVRSDPQNEGLWGLQPRALGSKLDYFHAGITSTRLHRHCDSQPTIQVQYSVQVQVHLRSYCLCLHYYLDHEL